MFHVVRACSTQTFRKGDFVLIRHADQDVVRSVLMQINMWFRPVFRCQFIEDWLAAYIWFQQNVACIRQNFTG